MKRPTPTWSASALPWVPPELREDDGEIEAAESGRVPRSWSSWSDIRRRPAHPHELDRRHRHTRGHGQQRDCAWLRVHGPLTDHHRNLAHDPCGLTALTPNRVGRAGQTRSSAKLASVRGAARDRDGHLSQVSSTSLMRRVRLFDQPFSEISVSTPNFASAREVMTGTNACAPLRIRWSIL